MSQTVTTSELLIDSFFECFDKGELSDSNFKKECESGSGFEKVKDFIHYDHNCDLAGSDSLTHSNLQVVTWILEKFNKYLSKIGTEELSTRLSQFDENVSEDYFLRLTDSVPANSAAFKWFELVWYSTFNRVSCYEKSISYASTLHSQSVKDLTNKHTGLQKSIINATTLVDGLCEQVNGKDGQDGLIQRVNSVRHHVDDVRESIHTTTVTILGIFAAIVLAFSGVFSFSSSVLQSINEASIYRLVGVSAVLGIVGFNLIFCLISYLLKGSKIHNEAFSKIKFYFPVLFTDIFLIVVLVLTILSWRFGWLEKKTLNDPIPSSSISSCINDIAPSDAEIMNTVPPT